MQLKNGNKATNFEVLIVIQNYLIFVFQGRESRTC